MIDGPLTLPSSVGDDFTVMSGLVANRLTETVGAACAASGRSPNNPVRALIVTTARHTQATVQRVMNTSRNGRDSDTNGDQGSAIRQFVMG